MIGDNISYHPEYKQITDFVVKNLEFIEKSNSKLCISVGGESGCGKTSLANSLKIDIEKAIGLKGFIFHLDDYFKLPPADNHNARLKDNSLVGMNEVNLELLDLHLVQFKEKGGILNKPLVDYPQNKILNEQISCNEYDFCIVEGTYVSVLKAPDYRIFIETTYLDTRKLRVERGRDLINSLNERVLEIEHQIIKSQCELANVIIDNKLNVITKK
ncbi:MAG: hypothetical protein KAJ28_01485 [Flavobacteriaceae bacterium]|nr:hypothetical protein [Flavobacteriaceae bacterium]